MPSNFPINDRSTETRREYLELETVTGISVSLNPHAAHDDSVQKATNLISFLEKIAILNAELIRNMDSYEEVLWISDIPRENGCFAQAWGTNENYPSNIWLEVKKPEEPEQPIFPQECEEWIKRRTCRNKKEQPELLTEIKRKIPNPDWQEDSDEPKEILSTKYLKDHPNVQDEWDYYVKEQWRPWADSYDQWEKIKKAYGQLFKIHERQQSSEKYENVIGLGLLTWQPSQNQRTRRHLLVANARLDFEERSGTFTLYPDIDGAKLRPELDMLDIEQQPVQAEQRSKHYLVSARDDPWQKAVIDGVLQGLVNSLAPESRYDDLIEAKNTASKNPVVEYSPALILRKRPSKNLTEVLKKIKEQIEFAGGIRGLFAELAEIEQGDVVNSQYQAGEAQPEGQDPEDRIFFPKPSNNEQRRVVEALRRANGVLVQGPPGTGKSHTIANLICHLLATGNRILITAKKAKAVEVLLDLVPKELRPLCISMLGKGVREESRSLESGIVNIIRRWELWDSAVNGRDCDELETRLDALHQEKARYINRLRTNREAETYPHTIAAGAYSGTAAEIAKAVERDSGQHRWFTDAAPLRGDFPITISDFQQILSELRLFTPDISQELGQTLPDVSASSVADFSDLVQIEEAAIAEERTLKDEVAEHYVDLLVQDDPQAISEALDSFSTFSKACLSLHAINELWINTAVSDILNGRSYLWCQKCEVIRKVIQSIEGHTEVADHNRIEYPNSIDINHLYEDALKLKDHLENGGKLGWGIFRSKVVNERRYLLTSVRVAGQPCTSFEHFSLLTRVLRVHIECSKAWNIWNDQLGGVEESFDLQLAQLKSLHDTLEKALSLDALMFKCQEIMDRFPSLENPIWTAGASLKTIIKTFRLAKVRICKNDAANGIEGIKDSLSRIAYGADAHQIVIDLLDAINDRNVERFSLLSHNILNLREKRQILYGVNDRLSRLSSQLPHLVENLKETYQQAYWENRIENINGAWRWAQAKFWLEENIQQQEPVIAQRIKQIENEINEIIGQLASLKAWSFCLSRLSDVERQHMIAWQQALRGLGQGTGEHALHHLHAAQEHLEGFRKAVPAWIMPLNQVWGRVAPEPDMFDVIIVDEASQCGIEALPLLYMGKKVVIIGDDKQISPDPVGIPHKTIYHLQEQFLGDFEFISSFEITNSLFDVGKRLFSQHLTLREHFRCMPDIIGFSNNLCYSNSPLIPLRQYGLDRLPPLENIYVESGYCEGRGSRITNSPEAETIVNKIAEICEDSRYDGKTIGVVTLQGSAQSELIQIKLRERLGIEEFQRRALHCGKPADFQGDQRDIIFLSLVAACDIGNKKRSPRAMTTIKNEQCFNVAASRARDQMILVHSVSFDDLQRNCLRRHLLDFFEGRSTKQIAGIDQEQLELRAHQDDRSVVNPPQPFDSWFEVDVALEMLRRNFTVLAQHQVGTYRLDLVVVGGSSQIAVECDGDYWHGPDRYEDDMQRQRQLERCGWEFFRIRESVFYSSRENALNGLWQILEERGVVPNL